MDNWYKGRRKGREEDGRLNTELSALHALIYLTLTTYEVGSVCEIRTVVIILQERKLRYGMVK